MFFVDAEKHKNRHQKNIIKDQNNQNGLVMEEQELQPRETAFLNHSRVQRRRARAMRQVIKRWREWRLSEVKISRQSYHLLMKSWIGCQYQGRVVCLATS